ncbi:MAG: ribonuclease HII [Steroidobacteraceae bacterium]
MTGLITAHSPKSKVHLIIGVDEAGRGPLAGPVVASAVILDPDRPIAGLNDSKQLSEKQRERLAPIIREQALAWAVASASVVEIDTINILQATLLAMRRTLQALQPPACHANDKFHLQVDGNKLPDFHDLPFHCSAEAVVAGDALIPAISAASILAKVTRDAWLLELHQQYPVYGFAKHKGYGTAAHLQALQTYGICPEHRRSFAPVRVLIS